VRFGVTHLTRRSRMKEHRFLSILLGAVLLTGCAAHTKSEPRVQTDDRVGAGVANVWYVPGRALVCGGSAVLAGVVMTLTLGQSYDSASELMHGGCSGPWTVGPREIRAAVADR
jgi:hypothetical protein